MEKEQNVQERTDKIKWHQGFYGATELELRDNKDDLTFEQEHSLGKEPVRLDLLILKKKPGAVIINEIGKLFRTFNVLEFKGPGDNLNLDSFFKSVGYACLYKGLGETAEAVPDSELTLSLVQESYPMKMIGQLQQRGARIEGRFPGIYYVEDYIPFPVQIIVISQLNPENHFIMRLLTRRVRKTDVRHFFTEAQKYKDSGDRHNADALLRISIQANKSIFNELKEEKIMSYQAIAELFHDEIEEAKIKNDLSHLRNLMSFTNWSAEKAMESMGIPKSEWNLYAQKLSK